jgi:Holliday junction resolvase
MTSRRATSLGGPTGATERPRKPKGGAGPYRRGAAAERRVQRALEADGWLVTRQPKSQSPYDLMCIHPFGMVDLVQVKSRNYLTPIEKTALIEVAYGWDCEAVLAWIEVNTLKRRVLTTGETLEDLACPK